MKTARVTLLILWFMFGQISCERCPDVPEYFSIVGLEIANVKYTDQNSYSWKLVENGESVLWSEFFIRVGFEKTYYSENKKSGANLFADCLSKGYGGSKIGIDTLYLITMKDYDTQHFQNDTLNNIVYSLANYFYENKTTIYGNSFDFKISEPPAWDNEEYQFKLVYILNNGETFTKESSIVRLNI